MTRHTPFKAKAQWLAVIILIVVAASFNPDGGGWQPIIQYQWLPVLILTAAVATAPNPKVYIDYPILFLSVAGL
jgi:hypothetical protein